MQRVRFEVSNEGGASSGAVTYQLQGAQSATCGTGTYVVVPVGAWDWQVTDSTLLTDGSATTDWGGVTNDATTFVAGQVKDAGNATAGITLAADAFTEIEFAVRATATAVAGATTASGSTTRPQPRARRLLGLCPGHGPTTPR